jgi:pimeloyl-ACP methyl ester carboxylesterase
MPNFNEPAGEASATLGGIDRGFLCFADWGPADGYPVFSLHGSPGCRLSIRGLDQARALGCRLITYDRPGNGRSDRLSDRNAADCVPDGGAEVLEQSQNGVWGDQVWLR